MTSQDAMVLYIATLTVMGGLSGFVISHLLTEIKRLHERVDGIYNILMERQTRPNLGVMLDDVARVLQH